MQHTPRLIALLIASALAATPALAQDKKPAEPAKEAKAAPVKMPTVNGTPIQKSWVDNIVKSQAARGAPDTEEVRKQIVDGLVNQMILVQEAKKAGLEKNPEITNQLEMTRQNVLASAYVQDYLKKHPVPEASIKAQYEKVKANLSGDEYKSRHILVEKEDEAKAIIEKLGKGGKFEELAKQSKDPGSKEKGGELGWSAATAYVPPFADALKKLKKGEYTKEPVKTDFGYHVIELEDTRPVSAPPYEQLKPQLEQAAKREQIDSMLKDLRAKAKIVE